jgi:hypothetical protein
LDRFPDHINMFKQMNLGLSVVRGTAAQALGTRDREFESRSLQRRITCEPDFVDHRGKRGRTEIQRLARHLATTRKQHRRGGKLESAASDQQIDDEYDQQDTADTDAAAIPPPVIAETAAEDEDQYDNNQDQVHPLPPLKFPNKMLVYRRA